MNYTLLGEKCPNFAYQSGHNISDIYSLSYHKNTGLDTQGCSYLAIYLKHGYSGSASQLIEILKSIPESVKELNLFWRNKDISAADYTEILQAIPKWIKKFTWPRNTHGSLSLNDIEVIRALPITCKKLWRDAFNITKADDLILLLNASPPSITQITLFADHLKDYSQQQLLDVFAALPATVKKLKINLSGFKSDLKTVIRIFNCMPASLTHLRCPLFQLQGVSYENEESITTAEQVLRSIPPFIIDFKLKLPSNISADRATILHRRLLQAIPNTIKNLEIYNFLVAEISPPTVNLAQATSPFLSTFHMHVESEDRTINAIAALNSIPATAHKLSLQAKYFSTSCLLEVIKLMPCNISELEVDFSECSYPTTRAAQRTISINNFVAMLSFVPASVKKLSVRNYLPSLDKDIASNDLHTIYMSVPTTVEMFNLDCYNEIFTQHFKYTDSMQLLKILPQSYGNELCLDFGSLTNMFNTTDSEKIELFKAVPNFISVLKVHSFLKLNNPALLGPSDSATGYHSADIISQAFHAIPQNVTVLDLRNNYLFKLGIEGIITALKHLHLNVKRVDLRDNFFKIKCYENMRREAFNLGANFSGAELTRLIQETPEHITDVHIDYEDMLKIEKHLQGNFAALGRCYDNEKQCFSRVSMDLDESYEMSRAGNRL